jgi:hypothetical protein
LPLSLLHSSRQVERKQKRVKILQCLAGFERSDAGRIFWSLEIEKALLVAFLLSMECDNNAAGFLMDSSKIANYSSFEL